MNKLIVSCKSDGTCTVTETSGRGATYSGSVITINSGGSAVSTK